MESCTSIFNAYFCKVKTIYFNLWGLNLQEPMALILNWIIASFCVYAFFKLNRFNNKANSYWRMFYLFFGISTFFGGLGHVFFLYTGIPGKFPSWIFGALANGFAALGVLNFKGISKPTTIAYYLVWIKCALLVVISMVTQKFIFIAIDAIVTYLCYTGIYLLFLQSRTLFRYFISKFLIGVVILLPSAFFFILKINLHDWLNKDDVSHILMLIAIVFFYQGLKEWGHNHQKQLQDVEE